MRKVRSRGTSWTMIIVIVVAVVLVGVMALNAYKNTEPTSRDRVKMVKESFANHKKEKFMNKKK